MCFVGCKGYGKCCIESIERVKYQAMREEHERDWHFGRRILKSHACNLCSENLQYNTMSL